MEEEEASLHLQKKSVQLDYYICNKRRIVASIWNEQQYRKYIVKKEAFFYYFRGRLKEKNVDLKPVTQISSLPSPLSPPIQETLNIMYEL